MLPCRSAKLQNGAMFDWNDLRYFLAVEEHGSTLAAGRALRVSQTTVARRIAALEEVLGLTLFDRHRAGYALTPAGKALMSDARNVASSAEALAETAAARSRAGGGTVRLTAEEAMVVGLLPAMLRELREAYPEIVIEVDASEAVRDLGEGAADVALRMKKRLDGGGLFGRRVGQDYWTVYCSRSYAEAHGAPRSRHDLASHPLVSVGGAGEIGLNYRLWLRLNGLEQAVAMQHATVTGLLSAVRSGLGVAALPCIVAEMDETLLRCLPARSDGALDIWLVSHERLRHEPAVRTVLQFLGDRIRSRAELVHDRLIRLPPVMR
jgi:DNA-binding transcriptional LysR family regulator